MKRSWSPFPPPEVIESPVFPMTGSIRRGGTISYSIPQFYKMILFTIPDNVESIEFCAFSGCDKLRHVIIPDSVKSIESYAFSGCSSLNNVKIPNSVIEIGVYAFSECSSLTNIKVSNNITRIRTGTFSIHTHTVCVPYYKAAPYNISHTKIFSRAKYNRVI